MITYEQFCQIKSLCNEGLTASQIARKLELTHQTVSGWMKQGSYRQRKQGQPKSKLDPFKNRVIALLDKHPYSVAQIFNILKQEGYLGGDTILGDYIRKVRPKRKPAYLTLSFGPGECAQVDWGSYGSVTVGNTTRRLSFFAMVLCFSRMLYVKFTLSQKMEHFLQCHQEAFEFFGGVPEKIMVDNLKSAVLEHRTGQPIVYNPHYLDFAKHYGFDPRACNVRRGNEKGGVENAVGYVKKNLLSGFDIHDFKVLEPATKTWLDTIANVRNHGTTHKKPIEMFELEKPKLRPLPIHRYDVGITEQMRVNKCFRITLDTNRYSVPFEYSSQLVKLKRYPDKLRIYHSDKLIAEHLRSYERRRDFENPDHVVELLKQKRKAREQHHLTGFLMLSPIAESYYRKLQTRRFNAPHHVEKILALSEIYGTQKTARALQDAHDLEAISCEYIANLLEQREKRLPQPGALHLTRREDLLEIELPQADINAYDKPDHHNNTDTDNNHKNDSTQSNNS